MAWSPLEVMVNAGYVLMLGGFLLRDVLWLRSALAVGQVSVVIYACAIGRPSVAFWNGLFALINTMWVARIVRERRPVQIPEALRDLYDRVFRAMSPQEFLAFWQSGRTESWGDRLVVGEGTRPPAVYLVLEGLARVERGGCVLSSLERGHFLAEMSFLTDQPASANIRGDGALATRAWTRDQLRALQRGKPALFMKLQGVMGCDLAAKIRDANAALAARA